ncbi:monocarboxylate transporter 12-B [Chanos chanos]|uniref:Monocarboxylate transporter 12-B n=1 Tax=Chanos chanos TaxID=29144 RepID=A0A6J2WJ35_CHACN|nr:monocarboxylate transporter 12-B-like [Chanos chanos]
MAEKVKGPPGSAPDGGWGWMIVAACFVTTICTRAVTRCVSIFFMEFQLQFSRDYSRTAWIHSLVDCMTMVCAPLGSYLGNRLSPRVAVMLGGLLSSTGLVLSSFATSLEYLYITLGILTGLGFALSYTPAVATVGTYFSKRKALAYGIAMSGSGIGTFVLAPVVQLLIEFYSWRGAFLILAGFVSHLCVCGALMRPLVVLDEEDKLMKEKGFLVELPSSELTEAKQGNEMDTIACPKQSKQGCLPSVDEYRFLLMSNFLVLALSVLFLASGCSLPFVYLVPYSLSMSVSHQQAALLMSLLGITSIMGNITFGWLTDRRCLRPFRVESYMFAVGLEGLSCLFVPMLQSFPSLVPFALVYGYFDGAYVALIPVVTSDTVGPTYFSPALGVVCFLHAMPYLFSPPIAGWLVDQRGSYTSAFFLSGFSLMFSSVILALFKLIQRCHGKHPRLTRSSVV